MSKRANKHKKSSNVSSSSSIDNSITILNSILHKNPHLEPSTKELHHIVTSSLESINEESKTDVKANLCSNNDCKYCQWKFNTNCKVCGSSFSTISNKSTHSTLNNNLTKTNKIATNIQCYPLFIPIVSDEDEYTLHIQSTVLCSESCVNRIISSPEEFSSSPDSDSKNNIKTKGDDNDLKNITQSKRNTSLLQLESTISTPSLLWHVLGLIISIYTFNWTYELGYLKVQSYIFFTIWNITIQLIFFSLFNITAIIHFFIPFNHKFYQTMRSLVSIVFVIAFIISCGVTIIFWGLMAINRELIFPTGFVFPWQLNHLQHTTPFVIMCIELFCFKHKRLSNKTDTIISLAIPVAYLSLVAIINYLYSFWPYPFMKYFVYHHWLLMAVACSSLSILVSTLIRRVQSS